MSSIKDLPKHVGENVEITGWTFNYRSSGKISFLTLRDGTGFVQGVIEQSEVNQETWEAQEDITLETPVRVTGEVTEDERAPSGVEVQIEELEIIQESAEYPIGKKEHGPDFLLQNRHLWIRHPKQAAILRIRAGVEFAIHKFLREHGFIQFDAPIFTANPAEDSTELFELEYFGEKMAYLTQSGQLYAEAGAEALGKVYTFGPTFRAEKSKTRRHLTEFWMIEPEAAFMDFEENLTLQEDFLKYIIEFVLDEHQSDLKTLERDTDKLAQTTKKDFPRITYEEAIAKLQDLGSEIQYGEDFGGDDETKLTKEYDTPIFVTHFPADMKAFYMKPDSQDDSVVLAADVLAPEGYGEIIGGSERIGDIDLLEEKIKEFDLNADNFQWYVDLRRYGGVPHSGFGLGLERTLAWICGVDHVRETIPFPRLINRIRP